MVHSWSMLLNCTACGNGVSVHANACPRCSHPTRPSNPSNKVIALVLVGLNVVFLLVWLMGWIRF